MSIITAVAIGSLGVAPVALVLGVRYLRLRNEIDRSARSAMRSRSLLLIAVLHLVSSLLAFFSGALALPVIVELAIAATAAGLLFRAIRIHSRRGRRFEDGTETV
jgi:uncharacterized integral membrane protein